MEKYLEKFIEISKIPRMSGSEYKISRFLIEFAQKRNLEYYTDELNNVIIWKEATNNSEKNNYIGLQCHLDMVCCKKEDIEFDFLNSGINISKKGNLISAIGTSLGADNGIGIAYILEILDSKTIKHPSIECIFTTQEETTMQGAKKIDGRILKAKRIISLDNQVDYEICIGSATDIRWKCKSKSYFEYILKNMDTYRLKIKNLKGGHGVFDIKDNIRNNPIKLAVDIVQHIPNVRINKIISEGTYNKIPKECIAEISIDGIYKEDMQMYIDSKKDDKIQITIDKIKENKSSICNKFAKKFLDFIYELENGVIIEENNGDVGVSTNIESVNINNNDMEINFATRFNNIKKGMHEVKKINNLINKYKLEIVDLNEMPGFENDNGKLVQICKETYKLLFKKEPKLTKVRFCLECGVFKEKNKDLDIVCIGPTIEDSHTIYERFLIESSDKMWSFLLKILENL